jgi:hypothetical protein
LEREAFLEEARATRRQLLVEQSRTWINDKELDDRIMLALKYPQELA